MSSRPPRGTRRGVGYGPEPVLVGSRSEAALLCLLLCRRLAGDAFDRQADIWFHLATGERIPTWRASTTVPSAPPSAALDCARFLAGCGSQPPRSGAGARSDQAVAFFLALVAWFGPTCGDCLLPFELARRRTLWCYSRFFVRPKSSRSCWRAGGCSAARRRAAGGVISSRFALVQIAWTNLHAAFLLGPLFAAIALAGDLLDRLRDQAIRIRRPRMALVFLAVLATLATPYGPRLLVHVLGAWRDVGTQELRAGIAEWQPTFSQPIAGDPVLLLFTLSLVGVAAACWRARRVVRGAELLLALAVATLACTSRRHLPLYAVTVLPIAARWVAQSARHRVAAGAAATPPRARVGCVSRRSHSSDVRAPGTGASVRGRCRTRRLLRCYGPPRSLAENAADDHPIGAVTCRPRTLGRAFGQHIAAGSYLIWRLRASRACSWSAGSSIRRRSVFTGRRLLTAGVRRVAAPRDVRVSSSSCDRSPAATLPTHSPPRLGGVLFVDGESGVRSARHGVTPGPGAPALASASHAVRDRRSYCRLVAALRSGGSGPGARCCCGWASGRSGEDLTASAS